RIFDDQRCYRRWSHRNWRQRAICYSESPVYQCCGIRTRYRATTELFKQLRQCHARLFYQLEYSRCVRNRLVDDAVEQIFECPSKLAQFARTHQTSTALQGMEGTAQLAQRFLIARITAAARQQLCNTPKFLFRLFHEDTNDLLIHV